MSMTILLVDDHAQTLKLAGDVLAHAGHRVHRAASGEEALAQAAQDWPALVLLDIQLPGIDGLETLARLRAQARDRSLKVIAMTASVTLADRARLEQAGFDAFLAKPFSVRTLRELVRRELGETSA